MSMTMSMARLQTMVCILGMAGAWAERSWGIFIGLPTPGEQRQAPALVTLDFKSGGWELSWPFNQPPWPKPRREPPASPAGAMLLPLWNGINAAMLLPLDTDHKVTFVTSTSNG